MEPLELSYVLRVLPPGRVAFRRWRWELWRGPQLLAAGWRTSALQAQRALRAHASRYAHRLHGLHPLRPEDARWRGTNGGPERRWGVEPIALEYGAVRVTLVPRVDRAAALSRR
jgi:hypothetical protein